MLAYFLIGIFPFAHYETDAMGVITGCKYMIDNAFFSANYYSYGFEMQPGIYFWVTSIDNLFVKNLIFSYSFISAFFGIGFLFSSIYFIWLITKINYFIIGIILLLFQEMSSAWYYMNSATGAAFFLILGLIFVLKNSSLKNHLLSAIALSLALWTRFDVIICCPIVFFLLYQKNLVNRLYISFIIGSITAILTFILYELSSTSLLDLIQSNIKGNGIGFGDNVATAGGIAFSQLMRTLLGFFSFFILLGIITGSWLVFKKKQYDILLIVFVPLLLFIVLLRGNITAGKHLLYYIPFLAIPVVVSVTQMTTKLFWLTMIPLFVLQYVIGFQVFLQSHPYISKSYSTVYPTPTIYKISTLSSLPTPIDSASIVIGGGMKLSTADEMLLSSGVLYSPIMWNQLKNESKTIFQTLSHFINNYTKDTLYITVSQGGAYPFKNFLFLEGFMLQNPEGTRYQWGIHYQYIWKKGHKYIIVSQSEYPKVFESYMKKLQSVSFPEYLHIAFWDWERGFVQVDNKYKLSINAASYLFKNSKE